MAGNALPTEYALSAPMTEEKPKQVNGFLTSSQTVLLVIIGVLAVTIVTLTILSSLQSSRNASTFETSSFLTTSLANIQRETLLLSVETERYINDPTIAPDALDLRRALLANQLRIHFVQAGWDNPAEENLAGFLIALDEFDDVLAAHRTADPGMRPALNARMDEILPRLDLELKILYDREEQSFFSVFRRSLLIQHNSERLLLVASGVISILGVVVMVSLGRTMRALRAETNERRAKEQEAQTLADESATPSEQAFSDGLTETLTRKLAQLEAFEEAFWVVPADATRGRGSPKPARLGGCSASTWLSRAASNATPTGSA